MIVKICGITNREDALAAVEGGASALGFNFFPGSPRAIAPEQAILIAKGLPAAVWKVGIFVDAPAAEIASIMERAALDIAQLHGACGMPPGIRRWKAVPVGPDFDPAQLDAAGAEAFLLDGVRSGLHGGTGQTFDWNLARIAGRRIVLAGGLDENNVRDAIEQARPWGVDACSRLESAPGRKDHARMASFLRAALS